MSDPTVSIVTPSFNHGPYIEATIRSVLEQDYPRLQYLVVDGGSTDQTVQILKKYESSPAAAGRFRWISEPDRGQSDAINKGFSQTQGKILGWLNSDDTYAPGAISAVARFFAEHPIVDLVYGDADFIDASGSLIARCAHVEPFDRRRLLYYSDFIAQPAVFFRRKLLEAVGGLDTSLNWTMDYDLWLKAAACATFAYLPRVLANYRWLESSKTGTGGADRLREVETVVKRYGAGGLPAYFRLETARLHLLEAWEQARRGRLLRAGGQAVSAAAAVLASPRAIRSLFHARTWKIIWTGQVLRSRANNAPPLAGERKRHGTVS